MDAEQNRPISRPIALRDCVFLCCLPLSQDKFERMWANSEFCRRFGTWSRYDAALKIATRRRQFEALSSLGLRGADAVTFDNFAVAIEDRPLLLGLLGHCRNCLEVEFADGFKSINDIVAKIPSDFDGVFDLSVCKARDFVKFAKHQGPRGNYRAALACLDAREWMLFYVSLFSNIGRLGTYGAAVLETMNQFSPDSQR